MIIEKREQGNVTVLELRGEVRLGESADALAAALSQVLDESERHVLLDFAQINYIDSTGIGELIGYLERFRDRHRRLALVRPSERVSRLLKLVRLDSVFRIYDTLEEALRLEDQPGRA